MSRNKFSPEIIECQPI